MALYEKLGEIDDNDTYRGVVEEFIVQSGKSMRQTMDHPKSAVLQKWMGEICLGRKLIISTEGYLGYTTEAAELEDEIWLIPRCEMPIVLRRVEGGHRLIGEAYIHGLMQGQALATDSSSGDRLASAFEKIKIV